MSSHVFNIPISKEDLLESKVNIYYVENTYIISSLKDRLKYAVNAFKNDGPESIFNTFDIYYSILYHGEKLEVNLIAAALNDLMKQCKQLCGFIEQLFTNSEIDSEVRSTTSNVLKMFIYLYTQVAILLENKIELEASTDLNSIKKKHQKTTKKPDKYNFDFDKQNTLSVLYDLLLLPISELWDPPLCEEPFIKLLGDVCFTYLINPSIKQEKELWSTMFEIFGILIKTHNYSLSFTIQLTKAIKSYEHLEAIVPKGIKLLVEEYNCTGLIRALVHKLTEWQSNTQCPDASGTKQCSIILSELTALMPNLIIPEIPYILQYLSNDSYILRNCILSMITELIINVLSKENMPEEHNTLRNNLLEKLNLHILDVNVHVRSKVLQSWAKLHSELAIPKDMQLDVFKKCCGRLSDKGVLVRKSALQLITTFLKYNPYAANLELDKYRDELKSEIEKYNNFGLPMKEKETFHNKEKEWDKIKDDVLKVIQEQIESEEELMEIDDDSSKEKSEELLLNYLKSGKYKEAFLICKNLAAQDEANQEVFETYDIEKQTDFFLVFLGSLYMNKEAMHLFKSNIEYLAQLSPEKMEELKKCELNIEYLKDVVLFLEIIENIYPKLVDLLKSASMTDVHETIQFIITAYQFKIKSAANLLTVMLSQMNTTNQERKTAVIDAYKTIFLSYDGNSKDKAEIVTTRLKDLLKMIDLNNEPHLSSIVNYWAEKGDIDNAVIQHLWQLFIGQKNTTDDDRIVALNILVMIATGKKTVIERNMNLVAEIVFSDKAIQDPRYLIVGCKMLGLMETEISVTDQQPGFRVPIADQMWTNLKNCIFKILLQKNTYCFSIFTAAINLIYKICQEPDKFCAKIIKECVSLINDSNTQIVIDGQIDLMYLSFFCHLLGEVAVRQFNFLDMVVYKELKRRKCMKNTKKKLDSTNISTASAIHKVTSNANDGDESFMEGAVAEDCDAEFILHICEHEIVTDNLLGKYVPMFVYILRHPHKFHDEILQATTAQAMIRFMIVSSDLCEKQISLIMTILEKSKFSSVINNIFVGLADLLHRFPNIIEPWSQNMYKIVKNENDSVRMTAVSILSELILADMLRVKGTIADLALCICDKSEVIVQMIREFFALLAQKEYAIYNVLPDIISRLSSDKAQINEDRFKTVMTFLIQLINKDKQIESLIGKLCFRFKLSESIRVWRDIAYCLSILNYNERSLLRLKENYCNYKICLEDDDVYHLFMSIIQKYKSSSKDEIRNIVKALEQTIKTGNDCVEDDNLNETNSNKNIRQKRKKK